MSASQEAFLIAPEVDQNLSLEERIKVERTFEKEITRLQHQCLKLENTTPASKDVKIMRCLDKKLKYLKREQKELNTKLKVAYAPCHVRRYDRQLKLVEDHVRVQDDLDLKIDGLRTEIRHLESQMMRLDKERKELQKVSQSDYFYYNRVSKAKKRLATLENRLDHLKKQEATRIAENHKLKNVIKDMLQDRKLFHQYWRRMVDELSYNKKFLIDMIERTILAFNQGEELCYKIDAVKSHAAREEKAQRQEMMELQRRINNDRKNHVFLRTKGCHRDMCDLDPKEVRRRNMVKNDYGKKLELYDRIIRKTKKFYGVKTISQFIEKYQKQEDAFFAHFNYLNEINRQYEEANCILLNLNKNVDDLKEQRLRKEANQEETSKNLRDQLLSETEKTQQLQASLKADEMQLAGYFKEIEGILIDVGYDGADMKNLLGEHGNVTKQNLMQYLSALEVRINDILAVVYTSPETKDRPELSKPLVSVPEEIVRIEEVVTTQQCAECAEGQDVNKYDEAIVAPKNKLEIKQGVKAKVRAPEMQYRLHNLSKCKLPRSRILVNKRYQ